jgi:preprotein translocase subunit SecG
METGKKIAMVASLFIVVVIGLIFLTTINQNVETQATLSTITDDQFTASNSSCVVITTGCIETVTSIKNVTRTTIDPANYTLCRSNTGKLDGIQLLSGAQMADASLNGKTLNATYTESAGCTYVSNSTARNLTGILVLLFVIAIVVIAIAYFKDFASDFMGK